MTSHKSVPSDEPLEATYPHRVTFQKAGWFHFAYCACGWIDCDPDQGMLTIKACCHGIIKEPAS